jgi:DNA invertase Pin-like site-specific DNA recombinase
MSDLESIKAIRRAAKRRQKAEQARHDATAELRDQMRQAQSEGVSISQIAREAGLSRQGVYDLLAARPS